MGNSKMKWVKILVLVLFTLSITCTQYNWLGNNTAFAQQKSEETKNYIIGLKEQTDEDAFISKKAKGKKHKKINDENITLELSEKELQNYLNDADVAYVELDSAVLIQSIDKSASKEEKVKEDSEVVPWGVHAIKADSISKSKLGNSIKIAVLDTGIAAHKELNVKGGISFVDGSTGYYDDNGHGTHVAGTINAKDNSQGVIGVAPKADVYSVKILDKNGSGSYSQVIQGIEWAIQNKMNIISMSFGGMLDSLALHNAIIKANQAGILVIAAAGNRGIGTETEVFPALYPEVVSVAAVNEQNVRPYFSSTGKQIDVSAPGVDILSTTMDGKYGVMSGTSMAVPHVTGAAAILWSNNINFTSEDVKARILATASPLGNSNEYGHGLVNILNALNNTIEETPEPTDPLPIPEPILQIPEDTIPDPSNPTPSNDPVPTPEDFILQIDNQLLQLSNRLSKQSEQAGSIGNVTLQKEIENKIHELQIKNTAMHDISEKTIPQTSSSEAQKLNEENTYFYQSKEAFNDLIDQYSNAITDFDKYFPATNEGNNDSQSCCYTIINPEIYPGQSTTVSLKLDKPQSGIFITVRNATSGMVVQTYSMNTGANLYPSFTWSTKTNTPPGAYVIEISHLSGVDRFTVYVKSTVVGGWLNLNTPIDVDLTAGAYGMFNINIQKAGIYKFNTGPFAGSGTVNDTTLAVYNDIQALQPIAYNNDANGTTFSEVILELGVGTYYIKVAHISAYEPVHTRVLASNLTTITSISNNTYVDIDSAQNTPVYYKFTPTVNGSYEIKTGYFGGLSTSGLNDTTLTVNKTYDSSTEIAYNDDFNSSFSQVNLDLIAGYSYYIKVNNYYSSLKTRLSITQTQTNFIDIKENTSIDSSLASQLGQFVRFTPTRTGTYKFYTGPYLGTGAANDTVLQLYEKSQQSSSIYLIASNDDTNGSVFSEIIVNLTANNNYYVWLQGHNGVAVNTRLSAVYIDTVTPSKPLNVSSPTQKATSIDLTWLPSTDNVEIAGYDVYSGSVLVGSTTNTTYSVTGLNKGTSYSFTVRSRDLVGNSSSSDPITVSTDNYETKNLIVNFNGTPTNEGDQNVRRYYKNGTYFVNMYNSFDVSHSVENVDYIKEQEVTWVSSNLLSNYFNLNVDTNQIIVSNNSTIVGNNTLANSEKIDVGGQLTEAELSYLIDLTTQYMKGNPELSLDQLKSYAQQTLVNYSQNRNLSIKSDELTASEYTTGPLNPEEIALVDVNLLNSVLSVATGGRAIEASEDLFVEESLTNGNGDAFRHAVWGALMVFFTDYSWAERWGNAHELGDPNNPANAKEMDLFNNRAGRIIGLKLMNEQAVSKNNMDQLLVVLQEAVLSALETGQLKRINSQGTIVASNDSGEITDWYSFSEVSPTGDNLEVYVYNSLDDNSAETRILRNKATVEVYKIINGEWRLSIQFPYAGDIGGGIGSGVGTASLMSISGEMTTTASLYSQLKKIRKINIKSLVEELTNRVLSTIGIPASEFSDQEDLDYFKQGIAVGLDDNILAGWYNRIVGLSKPDDEYFYLSGHQFIDCASIAFWATVSSDSAVVANANFAAAAASATAGGLMVATGVGAPVGAALETEAVGHIITGAIATLISGGAVAMSARSMAILSTTTSKKNALPTYNAGNFRRNLKNRIGDPPATMGKADAHHIFPQKFKKFFDAKLGKSVNHDPKYGSWWQLNDHRKKAREYNQKWDGFIESNPNATLDEVLEYGKKLAKEYGFSVNY